MRFLRFLGSPKFLGVIEIIAVLIVGVSSTFVMWKVVVSDKKARVVALRDAMALKEKSDQVIPQGTGDETASKSYKAMVLEEETKAKEEYRVARKVFVGYLIGLVVGSVVPILTGLFLVLRKRKRVKEVQPQTS